MASVVNDEGYRSIFIILAISGFSQVENSWKWIYLVYQRFVIFLFTVLLVSGMYILTQVSNIEKFNDIMCTFLSVFVISMKGAFALAKHSKLKQLQRTLDNNFFIQEINESGWCRKMLIQTSKKMHRLLATMVLIMITTAILWSSFPLLDGRGGPRKLPLPLPTDTADSPLYEVLYVCQSVALWTGALNYAAVDVMFISFIMQNCCHYNILMTNIKDLATWIRFRPHKRFEQRLKLAKCIRHHKAIINCLRELKEMFKVPLLIQMVGGTLIICVAGFEVFVLKHSFSTHMATRFAYMMLAVVDLYVYCAYGERVITKSGELAATVYDLPWYSNISKQDQHAIIMMLSVAPPRMSIGGFGFLGLPTYVSVIRTAYSTFSLLRQLVVES